MFGTRVRLAHVELTGLNPERVVDDAAHDRICPIASVPSQACQSDCLYCVQRMVNAASYLRLHELEDGPREFSVGVFAAAGEQQLVDLPFGEGFEFVQLREAGQGR